MHNVTLEFLKDSVIKTDELTKTVEKYKLNRIFKNDLFEEQTAHQISMCLKSWVIAQLNSKDEYIVKIKIVIQFTNDSKVKLKVYKFNHKNEIKLIPNELLYFVK